MKNKEREENTLKKAKTKPGEEKRKDSWKEERKQEAVVMKRNKGRKQSQKQKTE